MADDSSRSEAQKFNKAMLTNKAMLVAFARILAKKYDSAKEMIAAADKFIKNEPENGVADFGTDYEMVLKVQQTMQVYDLIYWNGFYKTTIVGKKGEKNENGPELVIAATLDPDAPYHVGLGRTQIIAPSFRALTLSWERRSDGVQDTSGKLIFNLVPTTSGATTRTLSGTWTDANGKTKILIGTETPDGEISKEEQKKLLPPGLVEILPLITALGTIVSMVGGVAGMLWIGKQWQEKNLDRAEKEAKARQNPDDEEAQEEAQDALDQEQDAQDARGLLVDELDADADDVANIPQAQIDQIRQQADAAPAALPPAGEVQADLRAVQQAQQEPEMMHAAAQLAQEVEPAPIVQQPDEAGEPGGGVDVEDGPLNVGDD